MTNLFCFRENKYTYFGCIPIVAALGLAVFIAFATQYYVSIFFLIQHNWFWFIALAITIPAHALLFWAIYSRKAILFYPLMAYEGLFITLFIGCTVWMIVEQFNPSSSYIFGDCDGDCDYCKSHTRLLAGINIGVFTISAILNVFVLDVFFRFRIYIDSGSHRPAVNVVSDQSRQHSSTYRPPTNSMLYSPGNVYQPQPLHVLTPQPQQPHNPSYQPYPTVRGATAAAYPTAPVSPIHNIYETPPPAYSQAVSEQKY